MAMLDEGNNQLRALESGARRRCSLVLAAALAVLAPWPAHAQEIPVVLMDEGEDACGTGRVVGLNPNGDGFLAVRSGPSSRYAEFDRLFNGDIIAMCDYRNGWHGIVYGGPDCAAGSPPADTQNGPYSGPCKSGWVFERYVELLAG